MDIIEGVVVSVTGTKSLLVKITDQRNSNWFAYGPNEQVVVNDLVSDAHIGSAQQPQLPAETLQSFVDKPIQCYVIGRDRAGSLVADVTPPGGNRILPE
jgi:hypothetical protein